MGDDSQVTVVKRENEGESETPSYISIVSLSIRYYICIVIDIYITYD
jgi:hypothetical protein